MRVCVCVCIDPRSVMEFSRVSNRQFQIYRVHSQVRTSPSYRTFQLSAESRRFIAFSIWRSFAKLGQEWSKNELGDRKRWIITVSKIKQGKFLKTFSFIFRYFSLYLTFLSLNFKLIRMEIFFFFSRLIYTFSLFLKKKYLTSSSSFRSHDHLKIQTLFPFIYSNRIFLTRRFLNSNFHIIVVLYCYLSSRGRSNRNYYLRNENRRREKKMCSFRKKRKKRK